MSKVFRCKCTCKETGKSYCNLYCCKEARRLLRQLRKAFCAFVAAFDKDCKLCIAHGKHGDFSTRKNCVQCNEYNLQDNLPNNGSGIIACRGGKCVLCVEKSTYKRVDVCHSQISFQDSFQIRFFRQFRRRKNCVRKARTLFECNKKHSQTNCVRSVMPVRSVFGYADAFGRCCRNCPQKTSLQLYCS